MRGQVLIIEDDEWAAALLAKVLKDAGFEVDIAEGARQGFARACELKPDCIVCDVALSDIDGFWVARRVRTEPTEVSTTPFLFLTGVDDKDSRLQGFNVGADAYMVKPFVADEVIAQVRALIDMASRLRESRDSIVSGPMSSPEAPAVSGDVSQMSIATLLTVFEMERRTGRLKVREPGGTVASFEVSEGMLTRALLDAAETKAVEVLREAMRWADGEFWFRQVAIDGEPQGALSALLLEAMRLEDEEDGRQPGTRGQLARRRSQAPAPLKRPPSVKLPLRAPPPPRIVGPTAPKPPRPKGKG